jgi:hypothetical protein
MVRLMLAASTSATARVSRHANKPEPSPEELRGMQALALTKVTLQGRRHHRYGALAGRHRVLRELGRIAEDHSDSAARTVADHLVQGLKDGSLFGSRHMAFHARALAMRFQDIRTIYGEARA